MSNDLLALLIEVSSVTASNHQMKKPLNLPRPKVEQETPKAPTPEQSNAAMRKGIGVLAATSKRVTR